VQQARDERIGDGEALAVSAIEGHRPGEVGAWRRRVRGRRVAKAKPLEDALADALPARVDPSSFREPLSRLSAPASQEMIEQAGQRRVDARSVALQVGRRDPDDVDQGAAFDRARPRLIETGFSPDHRMARGLAEPPLQQGDREN